MGYSIIAFGVEGETVATLETVLDDYEPAYALMGALGVPYDPAEGSGPGDTLEFTEKELHAAQAALVVAVNVRDVLAQGIVFLEDAINYMKKNDLSDIEIGFF
jgi:hypothetical protein